MAEQVIAALAPRIRKQLKNLPAATLNGLEEIRLRLGKPIALRCGLNELSLNLQGRISRLEQGMIVESEDIAKTLQIISQSSIYALEEELKNGYLTLPGGHRVGLAGQAVVEGGRVKTQKNIAGLNFRISREIPGVADRVLKYLLGRGGRVYHTLLISPPLGGKTTLLRDIIRQLSSGIPRLGFPGVNVGLADERSEVAGCYGGVPQLNVGIRTDVLDRCPKAEGMLMLLRSMSPQVVATDEIGRREDALAIEDLLNAGVAVITTVHGRSLEDIALRPVIRELTEKKVFERYVFLGRSRGVGTVEAVIDAVSGKNLWREEEKVCLR